MAKLMMTLGIVLSGHGLMAILASVSGMSTYLMVHAQITTLRYSRVTLTGKADIHVATIGGVDETSSRRNQ